MLLCPTLLSSPLLSSPGQARTFLLPFRGSLRGVFFPHFLKSSIEVVPIEQTSGGLSVFSMYGLFDELLVNRFSTVWRTFQFLWNPSRFSLSVRTATVSCCYCFRSRVTLSAVTVHQAFPDHYVREERMRDELREQQGRGMQAARLVSLRYRPPGSFLLEIDDSLIHGTKALDFRAEFLFLFA